jgi:hypothetical protein
LTRIRHGDSRHRNRNAQYLLGPSSKDFQALRTARRAIYTGTCALGDALAANAPPEKAIAFAWPDAIRIDGGLVGGVRLTWPAGTDEDDPPPWLVFGAMIRIVAMGEGEAGLRPLAAALEDEGFGDLDGGGLVESFARHLMAAVDTCQEKGFGEMAKRYLSRLVPGIVEPGEAESAQLANNVRYDIEGNGDLLVRYAGTRTERRSLLDALAVPSWLDPATGGPRR